jgi:putative hydrolase of the HAD superfamily
MIQAVIFDIGGVLVRTTDDSGRRAWEQRLGLSQGELEAVVFESEMGTKAQSGEITDEALWQWVGETFRLDQEIGELYQAFWGGDTLNQPLLDLIRRLRPRYQTAIISNATDALRLTLTERYAIAGLFDLIVGSAEEKVMKPDRRIYEYTLQRLGRWPEEAVFIDDSARNVAGATEVGMFAIHYSSTVDVAAELARLGIQLNRPSK